MIHAVRPVWLRDVARTRGEIHRALRRCTHHDLFAGGVRKCDRRTLEFAGARLVFVVELRATHLFDRAAGRHAADLDRLFDQRVAVFVAFEKELVQAVVGLKRDPCVKETKARTDVAHTNSGRFRFANAAHAPRMVPRTAPAVRRHVKTFSSNFEGPRPSADLGITRRVHRHASMWKSLKSLWFFDCGNRAFENQVKRNAMLVRLTEEPHFLKPLDHFGAEGTNRGIEPIAAELSGCTHDVDLFADRHRNESVGCPQVGILAHAHNDEEFVTTRMHIEVVAVVEIAIARKNMVEGFTRLMRHEFVHRAKRHGGLPL